MRLELPEARAPGSGARRASYRALEAQRLAPSKKNAIRLGAHLVFVDESGFMLAPTVLRTWAPRGQTPLLRHWARHDRISVISGLSVSPVRQHLGLYYQWHHHNFHQVEICAFLSHLLRHLRGPVIVLWDRLRLHRLPPVHDLCRRVPRLRLEYFPAYAPELNPDEHIWTLAKKRLANGSPDDRYRLALAVIKELEACRASQRRLRGCITHTGLPLFHA